MLFPARTDCYSHNIESDDEEIENDDVLGSYFNSFSFTSSQFSTSIEIESQQPNKDEEGELDQ